MPDGAPPKANPPDAIGHEGKTQPEDISKRYGWVYSQMTDCNTESTTLRPFQVGHTAPEWYFAAEKGGAAIQPACPAEIWANMGDPHSSNMLTKTQYDMRHGGNYDQTVDNVHGLNKFSNVNYSLRNQLRSRDKSWGQDDLVNRRITAGEYLFNTKGAQHEVNTYGPFVAEDRPGAFYPWGMIWDKQPSTDIVPEMHTQAPFMCKDTVPGQLFVKLGLNLTDEYDDTKPPSANASIKTFADFYWTGKLVFKAKPRTPHQTNFQLFYQLTNAENYVPNENGQFQIPMIQGRQIPKYMY